MSYSAMGNSKPEHPESAHWKYSLPLFLVALAVLLFMILVPRAGY